MRRALLCLILAAPAYATSPAVVQAMPPTGAGHPCASTATVTTKTCTFSVLPTAGNSLWVLVASATGTVTVTDNQSGSPNTYTQQATGTDAGGTRSAKWFAVPSITVNAGTFVVTATVPSSFVSVNLIEVSGQAASSFLDTSSTANGTAITAMPCGTLATNHANDLILAGLNSNNFGSGSVLVSAASPDATTYVIRSEQNDSGCCEASGAGSAVVSTLGNYKPQFVGSGGGTWAGVCTAVAIKDTTSDSSIRHRVTQ